MHLSQWSVNVKACRFRYAFFIYLKIVLFCVDYELNINFACIVIQLFIPCRPLARGAFTTVKAEIIPDNLIRIIPAEGCTGFIRMLRLYSCSV